MANTSTLQGNDSVSLSPNEEVQCEAALTDEERVDEAGRESFPASDPPSWTSGINRREATVPHVIWRFNHKCETMSAGTTLRVELLAAATIHWGTDDWQQPDDIETHDTGLGVHFADLPTEKLPPGTRVRFTFHWRESARWEGRDFAVGVRDT